MSAMLTIRPVAWVIWLTLLFPVASGVYGQSYPNRPIRIFAGEAGGSSDSLTRLVAPGLLNALGQQIIVENRPGNMIAAQAVANAAPDGYTLHVGGSNFWITPLLEKVPYDPLREFVPVAILQIAPFVLVVHPSVPAKSIRDLIALAKARPGELNYSSGPSGTLSHLAAELLKSMADIKVVRVPYKGGAAATVALIGGEVQLSFLGLLTVSTYVKSGKLRPLAVTSVQPTVLLPGVPTVTASGVPGFEAVETVGMHAPAKTSPAIINKLSQEIVRVVNQEDMKETFNSGLEAIDRSPEAFAATIKSSRATMGKLIKDLGLGDPN